MRKLADLVEATVAKSFSPQVIHIIVLTDIANTTVRIVKYLYKKCIVRSQEAV